MSVQLKACVVNSVSLLILINTKTQVANKMGSYA